MFMFIWIYLMDRTLLIKWDLLKVPAYKEEFSEELIVY
jgi:hypothetical protein